MFDVQSQKHKSVKSRLKASYFTSFDPPLHDMACNECSIKLYNIYLKKLISCSVNGLSLISDKFIPWLFVYLLCVKVLC